MKTPVIHSDDYVVYFENVQGYTFIHCDCYRWSKTTKQELTKDFDCLYSIHRKPIYAMHDIDDNKHLKFLTMMKFSFLSEYSCSDGINRHIYVRK